jgi:hypothetical protein
MATIPPLNTGALKVTFPANLPRNEKDLICMLLAGRLKDLWKGKLVCVQLAIDDLIKDLSGVSALSTLSAALVQLKSSLNNFKSLSGYDRILGQVNATLGQISNVFSLGGLCPSPVAAPKIPDVLGQLNQNLFGQANNIMNALAQTSNPKVCLGGGPTGLRIDWSNVTGDLKSLKNAIQQFKNDPVNLSGTMTAFEANLKGQKRRLNSELKRLGKNLTDPLGINEKRNTVNAIRRTKSASDDIVVKDKNGIEYKNPTTMMIPGDVDFVLNRTDPLFADNVRFQVVEILDYCGNVIGFEKKTITGDPNYMGWDTVNTDLNIATPTTNPTAGYEQYDYLFYEESGSIKIKNNQGTVVSDVNIARGKHYRIGLELSSTIIKFYSDASHTLVWTSGIRYTKDPEYGLGLDVITADTTTEFSTGEIDWAVNIQNPTTPNTLYWRQQGGSQSGTIVVDSTSPTVIPLADRTYDLSQAYRKAWLNLVNATNTDPLGATVNYDYAYKRRRYRITTTVVSETASYTTSNTVLEYNNGYTIQNDEETFDDEGLVIEGNRIIKYVQQVGVGKYFFLKQYINDDSGYDINQIICYLANSNSPSAAPTEILAAIKFDPNIEIINDTKLPLTDNYDYLLTISNPENDSSPINSKLTGVEELTAEISSNIIELNLSTNREANVSSLPVNEFIYSNKVSTSLTDTTRTYITTNPVNYKLYLHIKGKNNTKIQTLIEYHDSLGPVSPPADEPQLNLANSANASAQARAVGISMVFG